MMTNLLFSQLTAIGKRFAMVLTMLVVVGIGQVWGENFVINTTNFTKTGEGAGYAVYDGTRTISGVDIYSSNVMVQSSKLQFKSSSGLLYNTSAIPGTITKITLETTTNLTIYVGEASNPSTIIVTSGSDITTGNYSYFAVKGGTNTPKTSTITIEYTPTSGDTSDDSGTGTINFNSNAVKINAASVTGDDDLGNSWTITTVGTTSFTPQPTYSQVGSSTKPATSITFTTTLPEEVTITNFSVKFGGFSGTAGTITLKVDDTPVGTGSLNADSDVMVETAPEAIGTVLTVTVTGISKGVRAYYISYTYEASSGNSSACGWVETDINDIQSSNIVVITMTNSDGTYAMSNDNGTSSAPATVDVEVDGTSLTSEITDDIKWNVSNDNGTLTIYPNGKNDTWLYCNNTNNGVRVGTDDNKTFKIDATLGYLFHNGTSRYIGVYNSQDWRCYTEMHSNISNQTLKFYKYVECTTQPSRCVTPKMRG